MTLYWKDDPKPLKQICLVNRAFAPDILVGFNDSDYDWHFIMERAYHLNILKWMWKRITGKFKTKEEILKGGPIKIKISTEEDFASSFLKLLSLDSKANMPYNKMWKIYSENEGTEPSQRKYPGAYVFPPKKGIKGERPVTGLDFNSLYPSIIMVYKLSPEKFIFDQKDADIAQNNGNNFQMEKKDLYPAVLKDLFNKRLKLKVCLVSLGKKRQQLGKMISSAKERGKRILESLNLEYLSVYFDYDYWDSKQKALKIYMNTFYREAENRKSPIFLRKLAYKITIAEKYNLNLVVEFVSKKGKELSKEVYWTEIVKITMKKLHDQVNAYLRIKSEASYSIQRGKFQLLKYIKERIMREAMNINNTRSIHKIVEDTLKEAQNKEWDFNKFIRNERIPDPSERFSYVVVKGLPLYNKDSRKEPHKDQQQQCAHTLSIKMIALNHPHQDKIIQIKDSDKREKQIDEYS
ncbi:11232_t:CDS:10 [Funneliformis geosporum]|nr:11232_t:CDS:10 [Funneliformis geosporum]